MAETGKTFDSLRPNRFETERLALALAISFAIHLLAWGGYEFGKEFGWWRQLPVPAWLAREKNKSPQPVQNSEQPLEFVTVENPSPEAPKNAKYYGAQNSVAANPEANHDLNNPQLNGKQTEVVKTETVARPDFNKLQPTPPPAENQEESRPSLSPGDLTLGKPEDLQQQEQPRPRTIRQALAQHHLPGLQMRQNGGAHREALVPSLDVKATPFGAYDEALIEAVTQRWYDLLDSQKFALDRSGKVTLRFHLNYDGSVSDMQVLQNSVGDLLAYVCQEAINDPAPFAPWPSDMRQMIGADYREITFTFYYY